MYIDFFVVVVSSIAIIHFLSSWVRRKHPGKGKICGKGKNRMASLRLRKGNMGFDDTTVKTPVNPMSFWSALFIQIW